MNNFEDQLDEIRIKLYEETKEMNKEDIIRNVNAHAQRIAYEFGIKIGGAKVPVTEFALWYTNPE